MNNLKLIETDVFNEIATCDFGVTPTTSILSQENRLVGHWVIVTLPRLSTIFIGSTGNA